MSDNRERVALVTGGSGGIGRAVAERLVADEMAMAAVFDVAEREYGGVNVAFIAGPARWVNGQVIHVNGGAA